MSSEVVVRDLLRTLIRLQSFPGRDELLGQVEHVRIAAGSVTFLHLSVDRDAAPRSPLAPSPLPGNAWAHDDAGNALGTLLVWVNDGYLSALEYGSRTRRRSSCRPLGRYGSYSAVQNVPISLIGTRHTRAVEDEQRIPLAEALPGLEVHL